jgi:hypothetical protein
MVSLIRYEALRTEIVRAVFQMMTSCRPGNFNAVAIYNANKPNRTMADERSHTIKHKRTWLAISRFTSREKQQVDD